MINREILEKNYFYFRKSISIGCLIFNWSLLCVFFACNEKPEKVEKSSIKQPEKEIEVIFQKSQPIKLSNKNIVERLLEFGDKNKETIVVISTNYGNIRVQLYEDTPLHRANFLMLAKNNYYSGTFFDRVVKGFIIQGGSSDDEWVGLKRKEIGEYTIPKEIRANHFHKYGALAMARSYKKNPKKRSASFEFYIVDGTKLTDKELAKLDLSNNFNFTLEQKKIYKTIGGSAHLDGEHTVFGEVISGFDVMQKITSVKVDGTDWPLTDVVINKMEVIR